MFTHQQAQVLEWPLQEVAAAEGEVVAAEVVRLRPLLQQCLQSQHSSLQYRTVSRTIQTANLEEGFAYQGKVQIARLQSPLATSYEKRVYRGEY